MFSTGHCTAEPSFSASDSAALLWQIFLAPVWLLLGSLLFAAEVLIDRGGTITVTARRVQSSESPNT